jgi:hypothetical protein
MAAGENGKIATIYDLSLNGNNSLIRGCADEYSEFVNLFIESAKEFTLKAPLYFL